MSDEVRIAIPIPTSIDLPYNQRSWPLYAAAVEAAGGVPLKVDLDLLDAALMQAARECEGVLLPGSLADVEPSLYGRVRLDACGPGDPARERADRILLEEAFATGKPVLGICYGAQSLNVWRGGTLCQDLVPVPVSHSAGAAVAVAHLVTVDREGLLGSLVAVEEIVRVGMEVRLPVNSSHHQALEQIGEGLRVVAVSSQDGIIEAVEGLQGSDCPEFLLGVQWHPERSVAVSGTSRAIFAGLIAASAAYAAITRGR